MVGEIELDRLLELVCLRVRELIGARIAFVALADRDGDLEIAAIESVEAGAESLLGHRLSRDLSKAGRVLRAAPERARRLVARRPRGRPG